MDHILLLLLLFLLSIYFHLFFFLANNITLWSFLIIIITNNEQIVAHYSTYQYYCMPFLFKGDIFLILHQWTWRVDFWMPQVESRGKGEVKPTYKSPSVCWNCPASGSLYPPLLSHALSLSLPPVSEWFPLSFTVTHSPQPINVGN